MEFLLLHAFPSHNAHSNMNHTQTLAHTYTHTPIECHITSHIFSFFLMVFYLKHRISVISAVGDACKAEYRTLDKRSGQRCIDNLSIIFLPNWWQPKQLLNVSIFSAFLISSRLIALRFIYVTILKSEKPKSMTKIRFLTYRIEGTPTWSRQRERER